MKKLILITMLMMLSLPVLAEEQTQTSQDNKAVIAIQKQPQTEQSKQTQEVKNNWFTIVVQINGKALDDKTDNKK